MSHKKRRYPEQGGYGFPNLFMIIILILIVLQWFRVGGYGAPSGVAGAVTPEPGLQSNGGLFIIALFILIVCICGAPCKLMEHKHHKHHC